LEAKRFGLIIHYLEFQHHCELVDICYEFTVYCLAATAGCWLPHIC